ncbi:hypothetical protein CANARDRAFT_203882 [[Candida] arabinofermentans NRRL YB-2248]|uniref:t-SNARE coiled-coil homology domain-containing protein n=1 Tax=[Candida] arabinofermentans NRRL YB-2248 TaxID=983967 RepID=A0A1E4SUF9_9ASCO|nr:hypothetical protein CANARDRAFT_203882 [[Candida] arabinofermentans NRRL YB-2248]
MDPFNDVYQDATTQLQLLKTTSPQSLEFQNIKNELMEIINDLTNALQVIKQSKLRSSSGNGNDSYYNIDSFELNEREKKLSDLKLEMNEIIKNSNISLGTGTGTGTNTSKLHYNDNPFADDNGGGGDSGNNTLENPEIAFNNNYNQQLIQQQDDIISNELTQSIQNLHQQALTIGDELDYQHDLLTDVHNDIDRLDYKIVNNGIKKINKFLETNERGGNCCIAILIGVLIVVLVLLVIV